MEVKPKEEAVAMAEVMNLLAAEPAAEQAN